MTDSYGPPTRALTLKTTIRGLDVLQTIYGVIMGLGLKNVFDKAYPFFVGNTHSFADFRSAAGRNLITVSFLGVNTLLIGIRFFWAPRNLRSFLVSRVHRDQGTNTLRNPQIAASVLLIVLHAALYYLLCSEFGFFLSGIYANSVFQFEAFRGCALLHATLLVVNAAWILYLDALTPDGMRDGVLWARNNLAFSLLALPPLLLVSSKYLSPGSFEILESNSGVFFQGFPTAPRAVLETICLLPSWLSIEPQFTGALWVSLAFLANSVLDLVRTASHYMVLEEIEIADTAKAKPPKAPADAAPSAGAPP